MPLTCERLRARTIAVYENAPPLQVRASARRQSISPTALREQLGASVTDASGHAPAPTELSWSWSFGDGTGAAQQATPTHAFPIGRWFVTVVVTDRATGTGGTDTIPVSVDSHALVGSADRAGAGKQRTSPLSSGVVTGATTTDTPRPPSPPPAPITSSGTITAPVTAIAPAARERRPTAGRRPRPARPPFPRRVMRARSAQGGRLVRGLMIADVTPVASAASRLTRAAPAAGIVRAATHAPVRLSGLLAAGAILALLALGAVREHRGRP